MSEGEGEGEGVLAVRPADTVVSAVPVGTQGHARRNGVHSQLGRCDVRGQCIRWHRPNVGLPAGWGTKLQSVGLPIGIGGSTQVVEQPGPGVSMGLAFRVSRAR